MFVLWFMMVKFCWFFYDWYGVFYFEKLDFICRIKCFRINRKIYKKRLKLIEDRIVFNMINVF